MKCFQVFLCPQHPKQLPDLAAGASLRAGPVLGLHPRQPPGVRGPDGRGRVPWHLALLRGQGGQRHEGSAGGALRQGPLQREQQTDGKSLSV